MATWSASRGLLKGCGSLSGIQITAQDEGHFIVDRRARPVRIRGPFSDQGIAREAVETAEGKMAS